MDWLIFLIKDLSRLNNTYMDWYLYLSFTVIRSHKSLHKTNKQKEQKSALHYIIKKQVINRLQDYKQHCANVLGSSPSGRHSAASLFDQQQDNGHEHTARVNTFLQRQEQGLLQHMIWHKVEFKILLLTNKALNDQAPSYLKDLMVTYYPCGALYSQECWSTCDS